MGFFVHTFGDSTLDNYWWMSANHGHDEAKKNSVEGQIVEKLNQDSSTNYELISHAYDGFTTESVLVGGKVGSALGIFPGKKNQDQAAYLKNRNIDPSSKEYSAIPLRDFSTFFSKHKNETHYVVLSVGGNDFRERLANPLALLFEISKVQKRYLEILDHFKNKNIRPILMFQYRLDTNNDDHYKIYKTMKRVGVAAIAARVLSVLGFGVSLIYTSSRKIQLRSGLLFAAIAGLVFMISKQLSAKVLKGFLNGQKIDMTTLGALMETVYRPILERAKKDRLPILDLPNTFNPYNTELYIMQIEPSIKGGALIAEGLDHIIKNHDFQSESKIYSKSNTLFTGSSNPGSNWEVSYPK